MDYNLKGGVLIIGSLFWQDDRDKKGDDLRKLWRNTRLDMSKSIKVSVPIQYGRFSRDQVYTMVFNNTISNKNLGKAKAVPFLKSVMNWSQLRNEVEELSSAEGEGKRFIKWSENKNEAWCICAIYFNPKVDEQVKSDILAKWVNALKESSNGYKDFTKEPSRYCLSPQGELLIPWPAKASKFDFLIATSTQPRKRDGIADLTAQEIANHIANREYFIPNFLRGIGTYQDREILKVINSNKSLTQLLFKSIIENYELKKQEDKNHRYWSWDHCYNAFHSGLDNDTKALHLANYLASWGMNRGSGGLLQKDYKIHIRTIEILSDAKYLSLDCCNQNDFTVDKVKLLFKLKSELSEHYSSIKYERMGDQESISPTDTLISKILLGTLSCVPAYDEFLKKGLDLASLSNRQLTKKGLASLFTWIEKNEIQELRKSLKDNTNKLPVMKLLDMYFWSLGYNLAIIEK